MDPPTEAKRSFLSTLGKSDRQDNESAQVTVQDADDIALAKLGYKNEFKREFGNFATISFAFSIMGVSSSLISTYDTPYFAGGPAATVWCWFIGSCMCMCIGLSIAELCSAYPTSGGLYSASAFLVPQRYKAPVGWVIGWLNLTGQIAGVASTEFGLSRQIWAAYTLSRPAEEEFAPSSGQLVGLYIGLLCFHGLINCLATKYLARLTASFVVINMCAALAIWIALGVTVDNKNSANYIFTTVVNTTGYSSDGFAFLFGLLSVQWTMTDYDATVHISEEVRKASVAAPAAIIMAVAGTGIVGFILNCVLTMGSGDGSTLPGLSGLSAAQIIYENVGFTGFMICWSLVMYTTSAVVIAAMQANARTAYALSRDGLLPDRGLFGRMAPNRVPMWSVALIVLVSVVLGMLQFASAIALNAIFSLCAIALDSSYAVPILCKVLFHSHPEVQYKPGPFSLGTGLLGNTINLIAVVWISFVCVILAVPVVHPVTAETMNYSSIMLIGMILLSTIWYFAGGRKYYRGPRNFTGGSADAILFQKGGGDPRPLSDLPTVHTPTGSDLQDYPNDKASQ